MTSKGVGGNRGNRRETFCGAIWNVGRAMASGKGDVNELVETLVEKHKPQVETHTYGTYDFLK